MSIHETWTRYPGPQVVAAYARGRGQLPDDPEARTLVAHLAERYRQRRAAQDAKDEANEVADSDPKVKLQDLLTPTQIAILRIGQPGETSAAISPKGNSYAPLTVPTSWKNC